MPRRRPAETSFDLAAQLALRDSEQRYRTLLEATSDWFWELDADLRISRISPNSEKAIGGRDSSAPSRSKSPASRAQQDASAQAGTATRARHSTASNAVTSERKRWPLPSMKTWQPKRYQTPSRTRMPS